MAYADQIEARSEQPSLSDMVRRAVELLQFNRSGYFLVVDAGLMRKAAEKNNAEHTLAETVELDRALAVAQRYAGGKSAIFVCGDVGIGGLKSERISVSKRSGHRGARVEFRGRSVVLVGDRTQWREILWSGKACRLPGTARDARLLRRQNSRKNQLRFMPHRRLNTVDESWFSELVRVRRPCTAPWTTPRSFESSRDNF